MGCFIAYDRQGNRAGAVSVTLRSISYFLVQWPLARRPAVSVPLRGVKCFMGLEQTAIERLRFRPLAGYKVFRPLAQGVRWASVVSVPLRGVSASGRHDRQAADQQVSVPLRGMECFWKKKQTTNFGLFRPLAGCGLFWQSCTFFLVQQEKELSTLLFYCIILADGLSIAN